MLNQAQSRRRCPLLATLGPGQSPSPWAMLAGQLEQVAGGEGTGQTLRHSPFLGTRLALVLEHSNVGAGDTHAPTLGCARQPAGTRLSQRGGSRLGMAAGLLRDHSSPPWRPLSTAWPCPGRLQTLGPCHWRWHWDSAGPDPGGSTRTLWALALEVALGLCGPDPGSTQTLRALP